MALKRKWNGTLNGRALGAMVLGATLMTTGAAPALADYDDYGSVARDNVSYDYATVIDAQPIIRVVKISTPREECWEETVVYRDYRDHDDYRYDGRGRDHGLGTVLGGVVGGAIGNAVGSEKRNKQVGAVVGAVVGATLGNAIAKSQRPSAPRHASSPRYGTEEVCEVVNDYHEEERVIGYNVRYRYNDATYTTRMDADPGDTIKVRLAVSPVAG